MESEIRKVMRIREVNRREREKLFRLLMEHEKELERLTGGGEQSSDILSLDLSPYFQGDENYGAYFLEHEDQVGGAVLLHYVPAGEIEAGRAGKALRIVEFYLTPIHRGEGYCQFVLENILAEAERKRIPLVWDCPKAERIMCKLSERFCHWANMHREVNWSVRDVTYNGIEYKRFMLSFT